MIATTPCNSDPAALFSLRTLHLYTLSGFAFAQPLLTALLGQSVYLHDQQFGLAEMLILLALLLIVLPLLWVAADQLVCRMSKYLHCPGRNVVIGLLVGIVVLTFERPYVSAKWLQDSGMAAYLEFAMALVCAVIFAVSYERVCWLRSWLTVASAGLLIFPAFFLFQFQAIRRSEASIEVRGLAKKPVPVVFLVFDEFSGITLFNQQNEIDGERFPQFARLAGISTCYRNATTVNPRTDIAVPAILSGKYPAVNRNPLAAEYPGNLFQVIEATRQFEMTVFEPVSRLCPDSVRYIPRLEQTFDQKCLGLIRTVASVYPRLILAPDTPMDLPRIPQEWFGGLSFDLPVWERDADFTKGLFRYPGTEFRLKQQAHFLRCLDSADLPRFSFMHTVLPHFPWCFLPSGEQYLSEFADAHVPTGGHGELGEVWDDELPIVLRNEYRYHLQLGFADRFIGQVLDHLEETNRLDECLLIVTADHGVSFQPGNSRRLPDKDNFADILSVPMFIKFPGQSEGHMDDRNVETIDLYPTIADVLGIERSTTVDGISILQEARHPRKTFYFDEKMTIVEPDFPQRLPAIQHHLARYRANDLEEISSLAFRNPEWHGRQLESFEIEERSIPYSPFQKSDAQEMRFFPHEIRLVPNFIWGCFDSNDLPENSADILLTIDGIVRDSTTTTRFDRNCCQFQFLIPPKSLEGQSAKIALFLVNQKGPRVTLTRMEASWEVRREKM